MVLSMNRWVGKVAVVTGAASGIGAAIGNHLVEEGLIVVGIDLNHLPIEERSKKLSGKKGKLLALKGDIGKEEDVLKAFKWITENLGPVHVLVNSAGVVKLGSLLDDDTQMWKSVFNVNVLGLCMATREAVRIMKVNNIKGHIIHINSMGGHKVAPLSYECNVYTASKFAVTALTETLRLELNALGVKIRVTSVSPGIVESAMTSSNNNLRAELKAAFEGRMLKPEDVADGVVYVLSTPEHVQVHELTIKPVGETL